VAPILCEGQHSRRVYLPEGAEWKCTIDGKTYGGGQWIESDAPLEDIPLFLKDGADLPI
jgi:alpha-D-xyloside xylohydrolase